MSEPCLNNATCEQDYENPTNYSCVCEPGWTGLDCSEDIDECASDPCQNGATCTNLLNAFECECAPGFSGDLCEINIDECLSNPCVNGDCVDEVAGYDCECDEGRAFAPHLLWISLYLHCTCSKVGLELTANRTSTNVRAHPAKTTPLVTTWREVSTALATLVTLVTSATQPTPVSTRTSATNEANVASTSMMRLGTRRRRASVTTAGFRPTASKL